MTISRGTILNVLYFGLGLKLKPFCYFQDSRYNSLDWQLCTTDSAAEIIKFALYFETTLPFFPSSFWYAQIILNCLNLFASNLETPKICFYMDKITEESQEHRLQKRLIYLLQKRLLVFMLRKWFMRTYGIYVAEIIYALHLESLPTSKCWNTDKKWKRLWRQNIHKCA